MLLRNRPRRRATPRRRPGKIKFSLLPGGLRQPALNTPHVESRFYFEEDFREGSLSNKHRKGTTTVQR